MKIRTLCGIILAVMAFSAANAADGQSDASRMGAEMMNPGSALRTVAREDGGKFKVLVYGNSIALHGPKADIGWTNCWGMAASAAEKDFAHLVDAERFADAWREEHPDCPVPEYMEAFEVSEYGRAPTEEDLKLLLG